jgi:GMP synthase-like glutamine amidotransferase
MIVVVQNDPLVPPGLVAGCLDKLGADWTLCHADRYEEIPEADAAIILGGTMGVNDDALFPYLTEVKSSISQWLQDDVPLLGICLGAQMLAQEAGGVFRSACSGEHGVIQHKLTVAGLSDPLFAGLPVQMPVFEWHDDSFLLPPQAEHLSMSISCPDQAFRYGQAWGVQFHPEVDSDITFGWCRLRHGSERYLKQYLLYAEEIKEYSQRLLLNFAAFALEKSEVFVAGTPSLRLNLR